MTTTRSSMIRKMSFRQFFEGHREKPGGLRDFVLEAVAESVQMPEAEWNRGQKVDPHREGF